MARRRIARGDHRFLGGFQLPAAVRQILCCLQPAVFSGALVFAELGSAFFRLPQTLLQRPDLGLQAGDLRREGGLLCPQL